MSRKFNSILKKGKLTGEEVGRLMILDLIATYKDTMEHPEVLKGEREAQGILNTAQRQTLVDRLNTKKDISDYMNFKDYHQYLITAPAVLTLNKKEAEVAIWKLIHFLDRTKGAELEYTGRCLDPKIITQKQYDDLKKAAQEKELSFTESIEGLVCKAVDYYTSLYLKGQETPLDKYFIGAEAEPVKNRRIKKAVWNKPKNKLDVLQYTSSYYYSHETDSKETFLEFKADYPELFEATIEKLSSFKGLEFIKGSEDYFNEDLISYKTLIDEDIADYKKNFEDPFIEGLSLEGYAILQGTDTHRIDENGYYRQPQFLCREALIEGLLERSKDFIKYLFETLKEQLREAYMFKEAVKLSGELTGIPEVEGLIDEINLENEIDCLNAIVKSFPENIMRRGLVEGERPVDELKAELREVLEIIDVEDLKPKEENIEAARQLMKDLSIFKGPIEHIYKALRGGN